MSHRDEITIDVIAPGVPKDRLALGAAAAWATFERLGVHPALAAAADFKRSHPAYPQMTDVECAAADAWDAAVDAAFAAAAITEHDDRDFIVRPTER